MERASSELTETQLNRSTLGLSTAEKIRISIIYSALGIATLIGLTASIIIGQLSALLAGLGVLAFTFGLRHGVDADHIVAIDNTTRKLLQEGKRPLTVGMWFSLGHSTVVVGLIISLILATNAVKDQIPALRSSGAIIGTTVSGIFLFLIGFINVIIVLGIYRMFTTLKQGKMNDDTASEIALIAITVGVGVSSAVPLWMILVLPFMFTCGMVLVDMTDGITMLTAYGWAFLRPIRKIYYNLTVTVISVAVAFAIGGIELLQVLSSELKLSGPFWTSLGTLDFETMGFGIIGIFVVSWIASMAYWKYKRYDELYN